ncbi:MAG: hypothetical protein Q4G13_00070 [Moraxella sp.]|nr:hypothetical protein [Moraxella sp.]
MEKDNLNEVQKMVVLIKSTLCNADGSHMFTTGDELSGFDRETIEEIMTKVSEINGFDKTVADAQKN